MKLGLTSERIPDLEYSIEISVTGKTDESSADIELAQNRLKQAMIRWEQDAGCILGEYAKGVENG